jgi:hypothetical protein
VKTMLVIFFDWQGVIHKEFVPGGETINGVFCKGVMERLLHRIRRVRPGVCESIGSTYRCGTTTKVAVRRQMVNHNTIGSDVCKLSLTYSNTVNSLMIGFVQFESFPRTYELPVIKLQKSKRYTMNVYFHKIQTLFKH